MSHQHTRASAILLAVTAELESRRAQLDGDETIRAVTIEVKLFPNGLPRAVLLHVSTERTAGELARLFLLT